MKIDEARNKFVDAWGTVGGEWGISRTMAQIHALLLISNDPLSTEDIMEQLNVSRGNVNMNVRDLIAWGIVSKVYKKGERKEFFEAEKDIYKVAMKIMKERRKRELQPLLETLEELSSFESKEKEDKAFLQTVNSIKKFGKNADHMIERLSKADENWFTGSLLKFVTK